MGGYFVEIRCRSLGRDCAEGQVRERMQPDYRHTQAMCLPPHRSALLARRPVASARSQTADAVWGRRRGMTPCAAREFSFVHDCVFVTSL